MLLALSPKGSWLIMSGRVPSSSIYKKKKKKRRCTLLGCMGNRFPALRGKEWENGRRKAALESE